MDPSSAAPGAELRRLAEDRDRAQNWKRWGPYLSERQWATVREDYSANGDAWAYFPHDHARSRAYRWGEDGLLGFTDRECRLCFAVALWNGRDPILKERLFGLTGPEGNHGEDVKECYYYLEATPTYSYARALYKYPQGEFPYGQLVQVNRLAGLNAREFELSEAGAFADNRYFDIEAEYAKAGPDDILIRLTISNRGPDAAPLHLLPTLWFRNTWLASANAAKPGLRLEQDGLVRADHPTLGGYRFAFEPERASLHPPVLFTENETHAERLWGSPSGTPFVKDAFHEFLVAGQSGAVNPAQTGTKCAPHYLLNLAAGESRVVRLRLVAMDGKDSVDGAPPADLLGSDFDALFATRRAETDEFYAVVIPPALSPAAQLVARQGYAGLLWSRQFYHYIVEEWLAGDPGLPPPPAERRTGRNFQWPHLYTADVISMPDKWEYPWFAAWDLAFHMLPMAQVDPAFAKGQLSLFLREWYLHPNGQMPAYEYNFSDVNPPVHAWSVWRVYKMTGARGERDRPFLESAFQKLLLNFTWWVNRKDAEGNNLFQGGFLGLDNIGVFDRSKPLPTGGFLDQADGTAWMAFYCLTMLSIAIELAQENPVYEDLASKFFEHFISISDAINSLGGFGLWDELDGFYYDQLKLDGQAIPLRTRSLVGLLPLIAVEILEEEQLAGLPGFTKRLHWFLKHRGDLASSVTICSPCPHGQHRILSIPTRERLERTLRYALDENEFLSPYGLRSVSRIHRDHPYRFNVGQDVHEVDYVPGEGNTRLFGGNSNWRGPIWFPINYLLIEALERYHHFYGDALQVECPTGSGIRLSLQQVADELKRRLAQIFLPDAHGARPCHGGEARYAEDPHWRDLVLFYEYFDGETGRGCGASHQTGWTALALRCLEDLTRSPSP